LGDLAGRQAMDVLQRKLPMAELGGRNSGDGSRNGGEQTIPRHSVQRRNFAYVMPSVHEGGVPAMVTMRQLEAFCAVIDHHTVTEAARFMRLSQPAVSKLVSSLEEDTGLSLFSRD